MQVDVEELLRDIDRLLRLETELETRAKSVPCTGLSARVNLLKHLQVQSVVQYQSAYDALYYDLSKEGGLAYLRNIAPVRSENFLQPKLKDCGEDEELEKQVELYLAGAKRAKPFLDKLVATVVAKMSRQCEVHDADVKTLESTRRKASTFYGGDVRRVADMARVAVICDTPEALEQAYLAIMGSLHVRT